MRRTNPRRTLLAVSLLAMVIGFWILLAVLVAILTGV